MSARLTTVRVAAAACALLVSATAVSPAFAADRVYRPNARHGSVLIESSAGLPYWRLMARCAGTYGALANREDAASRPQAADAFKAQGRDWWNDAVTRLMADRRLSRAEAVRIAAPVTTNARTAAERDLMQPVRVAEGTVGTEALMTSACMDVRDAYHQAYRS